MKLRNTVILMETILAIVLLIFLATAASITNVTLNSTQKNNLTTENLTCTYGGQSAENLTYLYSYYKNNALNSTNNIYHLKPLNVVTYLPLDNDALDYAQNNNASQVNGTLLPGITGNAINCTGLSYLQLNAKVRTALSVLTNYTIILWFKTTNASATQYILSSRLGSASNRAGIITTAGKIAVGSYNGTAYNAKSAPISSDTWYHLIYVHQGNGAYGATNTGYLNGNLMTTTTTNTASANSERAAICRKNDLASTQGFKGLLDDLIVLNTTITQSEATILAHNHGKTLPSDQTHSSDTFKCQIQPINYTTAGAAMNSSTLTISSCITDKTHTSTGRTQNCGNLTIQASQTLTLVNSTIKASRITGASGATIVLQNSKLVAS